MAGALDDAALLIVDVQKDFCPGGALPVAHGDQVVTVANAYIDRFLAAGRPVFLSRDWHPQHTRHFNTDGGPWPPHCVQGTPGAEFHPALNVPAGAGIISKGTSPDEDALSAFEGTLADGRRLDEALRSLGVRHLLVGGLATDYCVRATALDALRSGFEVSVLVDASRAVNLQPNDAERAMEEMLAAGAAEL